MAVIAAVRPSATTAIAIVSHTADPGAIGAYGPLQDEAGRAFEVKVLRVTAKGVIARVAGIEDRNGAEVLRGTRLYIARARLPAPTEREFYHADLIGLLAVDARGAALGEVVSVQNHGAGDLLEIRFAGTTKTVLVPFRDAFVPSVDLAAGQLTIADADGLLD